MDSAYGRTESTDLVIFRALVMIQKSSGPTDFDGHTRMLAELLQIGAFKLQALAKQRQDVTFTVWSEAVSKATADSDRTLVDGQLEWLWEALTSEPTILRQLGTRLLSRDEEWKRQDPVSVLNKADILGVFLKSLRSFGAPILSVPPNIQPDGTITLLDTLAMGPGKAGRFECRDVKATVEMQVGKPGSPRQEAILMKLDPKDVVVNGGTVTASVRSLNHAFTVATRRLQSRRRSEGGRIYDHIAWRNKNGWVSLEDIRRQVEAGKWSQGKDIANRLTDSKQEP